MRSQPAARVCSLTLCEHLSAPQGRCGSRVRNWFSGSSFSAKNLHSCISITPWQRVPPFPASLPLWQITWNVFCYQRDTLNLHKQFVCIKCKYQVNKLHNHCSPNCCLLSWEAAVQSTWPLTPLCTLLFIKYRTIYIYCRRYLSWLHDVFLVSLD